MRFREWLDDQPEGTRARLIRDGRVTESAIARAQRGLPLAYANAERLSALTGDEVSIKDLCDPPQQRGKKRGVR